MHSSVILIAIFFEILFRLTFAIYLTAADLFR
jgi:hypothetical protein